MYVTAPFSLKWLFKTLGLNFFIFRAEGGEGGGGAGGSGGGSGGGNGGGGAPAITPEIQALIDAQVTGLKNKNSELLGQINTFKTNLAKFDGIDPDAVNAMIKRFADDEEAGLIKAGKFDEVLNKRTERMQADWQKKMQAAEGNLTKAQAANKRLADRALSDAILKAAGKAGALPEAMEDIVLRARGVFTINEDGEVVAKNGDDVILGKDGKTPLSPQEWAETLRETATHLWPKATGTGAQGSGGAAKGGKTITRAQFDALDHADRQQMMRDKVTVID